MRVRPKRQRILSEARARCSSLWKFLQRDLGLTILRARRDNQLVPTSNPDLPPDDLKPARLLVSRGNRLDVSLQSPLDMNPLYLV